MNQCVLSKVFILPFVEIFQESVDLFVRAVDPKPPIAILMQGVPNLPKITVVWLTAEIPAHAAINCLHQHVRQVLVNGDHTGGVNLLHEIAILMLAV